MDLTQILIYVGGFLVIWFIVDMAARIYLMKAPWEDYKEDQTESERLSYEEEQEAKAVEILSRYRIGRWLLQEYDKK